MRTCEQCAIGYESGSPTSRFCSARCRKAAFRARQGVSPAVPDRSETSGTTVDAVVAELEAVGRLETYLGRSAVALARRIDESTAVMGFAALTKELRASMDAALAGVARAADPVDELRARRERIFGAAG